MSDWPEGVENLDRDTDLTYSPDDEAETGKGYYLHRYKPTHGTSQLFATRDAALRAWKANKVEWTA